MNEVKLNVEFVGIDVVLEKINQIKEMLSELEKDMSKIDIRLSK